MEERLGLLYVLHDRCIGGHDVVSWTFGTIPEVMSMLLQATAGENGWEVNEVFWVDYRYDIALYAVHPSATDTWDHSDGYRLELDDRKISIDLDVFKVKKKTRLGGWLLYTDLVLDLVLIDGGLDYHPVSNRNWRKTKDTDCVMTFKAKQLRRKWLSLCRYGC